MVCLQSAYASLGRTLVTPIASKRRANQGLSEHRTQQGRGLDEQTQLISVVLITNHRVGVRDGKVKPCLSPIKSSELLSSGLPLGLAVLSTVPSS